MTVSLQAVVVTVMTRRQRPLWMTMGMLDPTGMFSSTNSPRWLVRVETRGLPLICVSHLSQRGVLPEKPSVSAATP
jgi:hypothetical protein